MINIKMHPTLVTHSLPSTALMRVISVIQAVNTLNKIV